MKKKFRLDFTAHVSVVVAVDNDDEELMEEMAVRIAEEYLQTRGNAPVWELDDEGFDDADDCEEAVNENG